MWLAAQHELLLQIVERPDDDQLRLVLADRLNEAGDPLGELISVQVSLERLLAGKAQGDFCALKAREHALVREHGPKWHQQSAPFARRLVMKRGLPHTLHCSANALLEDGGLTVLAPIQQLELEHVDAEQLRALFALPLLQRITGLGLPDLRGLGRLARAPGPTPHGITRMKLGIDGLRALDASVAAGLLDRVEDLELGIRWLLPGSSDVLLPPAAPRLTRLVFTGMSPRIGSDVDDAWYLPLRRLLDARPTLTLGWRNIEYDTSNLDRLVIRLDTEWVEDPIAQPAETFNREPFGEPWEGESVDRGLPANIDVVRLDGGALVASALRSRRYSDTLNPFSLDSSMLLRLPPHPRVLEARAFEVGSHRLRLRFEGWPSVPLSSATLPLPVGVALRLVEGIAHGLPPLRTALRTQGMPAWPQALSRDDVLIGTDGFVKLMPPFAFSMRGELHSDTHPEEVRALGQRLEPDLEGTDDGLLALLGTALMHLLAGEAVSRRLRPSALDPEWKVLDPIVEACLSPKRAVLFPSVAALVEALNNCPLITSQDAVAQAVRPKQSSPS